MARNIEADKSIDPDSLDVEWVQQPNLMHWYSRELAQCDANLEHAEMVLDVTRAEVADRIRRTKTEQSSGKERITDKVVEAGVLMSQQFKTAMTGWLKAKEERDYAFAAVRAIDMKRSALENLVKLHGQNYFAGPREPRDLAGEVDRRERLEQTANEKSNSIKHHMAEALAESAEQATTSGSSTRRRRG